MSSSRCRPKRQSAKRQGIRTPHLSTQAQGSEGTKCCGTVAALIWLMGVEKDRRVLCGGWWGAPSDPSCVLRLTLAVGLYGTVKG